MSKKSKETTIDRLKTMSKNSRGNFLRNNLRILKYGVIGYGRNIWLSITSTFVMALTLILLFVTVIASIILSATADRMRDKIDITIFFKPGTEVAVLQEMADIIKKDANVKTTEYSTSEQEYNKVIEDAKKTGDAALLATLNDEDMKEAMLKSMQSTLRIKVYNADHLDNIKEIMDKMVMYHVGKPSDGAIRMSEIVVKCVKHINKSIGYMGSLKKDHVKVEGRVHQVLKLESEADNIYHEEMAKLFTECTDPIEIIKWKEILSAMEDVIDGCEDLVGTFRRVVLKYA